jgi:signal transduction histidine kinase
MLNSVRLAQDTARNRRPVRLLVIDDDAIDRQTYRKFLSADETKGYIVVEAATAEEGARLLGDGPYDCIVLDYRLPGGDGLTMLQLFRDSEGQGISAPVVMMTGQGNEALAVEAMKYGISDYLTKDSLTAEAFRRAIGNAMDRWHLRATLREKSQRLEQANEELKRQAAELQRVYHTVSHELKTPLTGVREFIALVHDGVTGVIESAEQKHFLEHALDGCDQIARLVNDLIDSSRLDTAKFRLELEPVRADRIADFALASVRQVAVSKRLRLRSEVSPDLPPVLADQSRLTQVLGNLLGNACKFTESGGEISLSARINTGVDGQVEFAVSDTGCGIAAEHLDHVFDRLFQVPHAGDDLMGSGLGLGLSIARGIVELHGGRLEVESTPGVGSTFRFSLPVASAARSRVEFAADRGSYAA